MPKPEVEGYVEPMHKAAFNGENCRGQVKVVKRLIEMGANLEAQGYCGVGSVLHWACLGKQPKTLAALLNAGANIMKRNGDGWTPLRVAKMDDATECAEILEQRGAMEQSSGVFAGGGEKDDWGGVGPHWTWMDMLKDGSSGVGNSIM